MTRTRSRIANSNETSRIKYGIPHGTPTAKIVRKALAGRIGVVHRGLMPKMPARFPFSSKRAA